MFACDAWTVEKHRAVGAAPDHHSFADQFDGMGCGARLAQHIDELWNVSDPFRIEFVTAYEKIDIGRRNADIGVRSERPTEANLAGQQVGRVRHALYGGKLINGIAAGMFVCLAGDGANIQSSRWLAAHHGDRIAIRANNAHAVRELWTSDRDFSMFPALRTRNPLVT